MLLKSKCHQADWVYPFYILVVPFRASFAHSVYEPAGVVDDPVHYVYRLCGLDLNQEPVYVFFTIASINPKFNDLFGKPMDVKGFMEAIG